MKAKDRERRTWTTTFPFGWYAIFFGGEGGGWYEIFSPRNSIHFSKATIGERTMHDGGLFLMALNSNIQPIPIFNVNYINHFSTNGVCGAHSVCMYRYTYVRVNVCLLVFMIVVYFVIGCFMACFPFTLVIFVIRL